ncbi:hypothetical protein BXZ70DRAFT_1063939 [Cristinia sonorae]|uniref:BTB domain-containing protein n=1 Tax=Cristinia sonorae TaxID=1940300 RepID=A0A8K0XQX4_9AGAR|nr:hypothetical protein BXZ70DRAFT_1063939 [Cristinia sonorae]
MAGLRYEQGDIWFEDGNVILVAENTAFRAHKSILSRNSKVFNEMFASPQSADGETFDGCPVVQMTDTKQEISFLLSVLCYVPDNNGVISFPESLPFAAVTSMLQLGSKYAVEPVRQDAIRRLKAVFAADLDTFEDRSYCITTDQDMDLDFVKVELRDAIAVVDLAQSFDLPMLLPLALYLCAQLDPKTLIFGFTDVNGKTWSLSSDNIYRVLLGLPQLRRASIVQQKFVQLQELSPECVSVENCKDILSQAAEDFLLALHDDANPLSGTSWLIRMGLCFPCQGTHRVRINKEREELWADLAKIFELDVQWPPAEEVEGNE